jgi:hypothetical protein
MVLPAKGQVGSKNAVKIPVSGVKWTLTTGGEEMIAFVPTKDAAAALVKRVMKAGITVTNIEKLKKDLVKLKFNKRKD